MARRHEGVLDQRDRVAAEEQNAIGLQEVLEMRVDRRVRSQRSAQVPEEEPEQEEPPISQKEGRCPAYANGRHQHNAGHELHSEPNIECVRPKDYYTEVDGERA